ncbi:MULTISPECIES: AAA family ATPase [unclassified Bradyrhizobium]|uniref:AAA family ATPase n=1 Tax=unclassified Bradyrhizobium TaxID=2631580 RepID=UPI001605CC60|nr:MULTISPECIES: ATP-binding protein [unclassified Bradyrhizobium]MBB4257718.1 SpoVK/Ycf46/Vps4 family AAA+-type ATPase [Bradyrhizobium sp. CIR3A]MCK1490725.1 ATP-binding protein [Bradyrhizobium sp. 180]
MARSDLLLSLVKAGAAGDKSTLRTAVEALAADERAKRNNSLAEQLTRALQTGSQSMVTTSSTGGGPSNGKDLLFETEPKRSLSTLLLKSTTRRVLDSIVEEQHRADLLRSHGLQPRHRILLSGPPGNGKTSVAEALADALAVPFFTVRYDMLIGSYLGETTQRLRRLFEYVRTTPCVLLFDEFDAVGKERADPQETGEIKRVVSTLLLQIDALPSYVVVIAATNHGELLDRAVWRRFEARLQLPPPGVEELALFFDKMLSGWKDVDLGRKRWTGQMIARRLGPISYAEARDFCLDINRQFVLSLNQKNLAEIIAEQMIFWSERIGGGQVGERHFKAFAKAAPIPRTKANRSRKASPLSR